MSNKVLKYLKVVSKEEPFKTKSYCKSVKWSDLEEENLKFSNFKQKLIFLSKKLSDYNNEMKDYKKILKYKTIYKLYKIALNCFKKLA